MAFWNLIAKISADSTGFQVGAKQAESAANKLASGALASLKGQIAATFGFAALSAFAKESISLAGHLKDLSEQSGLTTKQVQDIGDAFRKSGLTAEDGIDSFNKLAEARNKALGGDVEAISFFNQLGISVKQLAKEADSLELGKKVGEALSGFNQQDRTVIQKGLFGKSGAKLTGALNDISAGPSNAPQLSDSEISKLDSMAKHGEEMWNAAKIGGGKLIVAAGEWAKNFFGGNDNTLRDRMAREKEAFEKLYPPKPTEQKRLIDPQSVKDSVEVAKIWDEISKKMFQTSLKTMTLDEQRAEISKQIKATQEEIVSLFENGDQLLGAKKQKELLALQEQYVGIGEYTPDSYKPETTSLQKIGALGSGVSEMQTTLKAQLEEQKKIKTILQRQSESGIDFTYP